MKLYNVILSAILAVILVSCGGEDMDFKEIDREMDNLEWRAERLTSIVETMKSPDMRENRKTFEWHLDEFKSMYSRLENEINDVRGSENDGLYSSSEINDVKGILGDLIDNVNSMIKKTDNVIKGLDLTGAKELKEVAIKFQAESSKYVHELIRLQSALDKLKADTPKSKETDDNSAEEEQITDIDSTKTDINRKTE